jgi:hypothetical protein
MVGLAWAVLDSKAVGGESVIVSCVALRREGRSGRCGDGECRASCDSLSSDLVSQFSRE